MTDQIKISSFCTKLLLVLEITFIHSEFLYVAQKLFQLCLNPVYQDISMQTLNTRHIFFFIFFPNEIMDMTMNVY